MITNNNATKKTQPVHRQLRLHRLRLGQYVVQVLAYSFRVAILRIGKAVSSNTLYLLLSYYFRYNIGPMVRLEYQLLTEFLVTKKGYDPLIRERSFDDDKNLVCKGLTLDCERGNLLRYTLN